MANSEKEAIDIARQLDFGELHLGRLGKIDLWVHHKILDGKAHVDDFDSTILWSEATATLDEDLEYGPDK